MILVTGGCGYIGSHLCVALAQAGEPYLVVDNFSNSRPSVLERVARITGQAPAFVEGDVRDVALLQQLFARHAISAVVHLAAFKAVGESVREPLMYYGNNVAGTVALLQAMRDAGVRSMVFSSSATVYGDQPAPLYETAQTGGCSNPYGWTKFMMEQILTDTANANPDMSVVLLRYFNPIGAHESGRIGEDPNGIPNNLMPYITQVAAGRLKCLGVFGNDYPTHDGTGVRDYIHVVDLAKGHVKAIEYSAEHKGTEIFNLGTGVGYSVLDIVKAFEKANSIEIPYVIKPRRAGDIAECFADATKAKKVLGWIAEKSLEDMCRDSWNWQSHNVNGYK